MTSSYCKFLVSFYFLHFKLTYYRMGQKDTSKLKFLIFKDWNKWNQYASKASLFDIYETYCKVLSLTSKYSVIFWRFKNFNKFFKILLTLDDYIIDVKIKKKVWRWMKPFWIVYIWWENHYDNNNNKFKNITKQSLQISKTTFLCIIHLSLGLLLKEGWTVSRPFRFLEERLILQATPF